MSKFWQRAVRTLVVVAVGLLAVVATVIFALGGTGPTRAGEQRSLAGDQPSVAGEQRSVEGRRPDRPADEGVGGQRSASPSELAADDGAGLVPDHQTGRLPASPESSLSLAEACSGQVDANGFATVVVDGPVAVADQRIDIAAPCRLQFQRGATLTLTNVELHSHHLFLSDDEDNGADNRLVIEGSRLVGQEGAGLAVFFPGRNDHVAVRDSTIDYPMGMAISACKKGPPASSMELVDVVLRANHEGAKVSAGGHDLRFEDVTVDSVGEEPMLVAEHCAGHNLTGATLLCLGSGP